MSGADSFPVGSIVRLLSGGFPMVVLMTSRQKLDDSETEFVHCCWQSNEGYPMTAAYPAFALRMDQ